MPEKKKTRAVARRPAKASPDDVIGVFDSGIGGLTVLRSITGLMPRENVMYLGDTARLPYGSKSGETVIKYAIELADFLVERGVKAIVVACNTMSAMALDVLRARFRVPILGVVEPGARAALQASKRRRVGVIGTEATIESGAYARSLRAVDPEVEIFTRACPLFVPLAEEGWVANDVARRAVATYLASLKKSGIDTLILGCTHYPLLKKPIGEFLGDRVRLVDSAEETALELRRLLSEKGLTRRRGTASASFFVTDSVERFMRVGERFYGTSMASAVRVVLRS
jgi:glutamate racemase